MANPETIREAMLHGTPVAEEKSGNGSTDADGLLLPEGLRPRPGTTVAVYTFPTKLTGLEAPVSCIMWGPTLAEEQTAVKRSKGVGENIAYEMLRISIRAVDGVAVNWADAKKSDVLVDGFLDKLGVRGRSMLMTAYAKQFAVSEEESKDFFDKAKIGVVG